MNFKKGFSPSVILTLLSISLLLTSCSGVGLITDDIMPQKIHHVTGFFVIYIILQISVLASAFLLAIMFDEVGLDISKILHFIWIVWYRDYGFWNVLFLYALIFLVSYRVFSRIRSKMRP